jgi:hypothetical protein
VTFLNFGGLVFCCVVFYCCPYLWNRIFVICQNICLLIWICLWCFLSSCLIAILVCICTSLLMIYSWWVFCLWNIYLCCLIFLCCGCLYSNICRYKVIWFCLLIFLCCFFNFCMICGFCFLNFCLLMICNCFFLLMRICLLVLVCLWNLIDFVCRSWFVCLSLDFSVCLNCLWSSCYLLNYFWNLLVFFLL